MLTTEDQEYVISQLADYYAALSNIRAAAVAGLHVDVQRQIGDVLTPIQCAQVVVRVCIADAWKHHPPSLVMALQVIAVRDAKISAIIQRLQQPPAAPPDPSLATVLASGLPFLNRTPLRTVMTSFGDAASMRSVLVVDGGPRSGRSYTVEYINHFCQHHQEFLPCHVTFKGISTEPDQVARDLVTLVGGSLTDVPRRDATTEDRWPEDLANWVLTQAYGAASRGTPPFKVWFILDGFAGRDLKKSVRDFIVHLAEKISTGIYLRMFRLVLLEFDRATLTVRVGRVATDVARPATSEEVLECVRAILTRAIDKGVALSAQQRAKIEKMILDNLPADETLMPELNGRLTALLGELGA